MMLKKIQIIFLVLLPLGLCIGIKSPKITPSLHSKMMKLLQSCFADRLESVVITPNLDEIFLETSMNSGPIPTIIMDENYEPDDEQRLLLHLSTFVFAPRTMKSFDIMLQRAVSSPWWHTNALFFVIGNSRGGCKSAGEILRNTWKTNWMKSFFLCYEQSNGTMLYTYNPFTNRAPHPWKEMGNSDRSDDRWTLFAQRYIAGRENCASLDFDKTKFMDGYTVRAVIDAKPGDTLTEKEYNSINMRSEHPFITLQVLAEIIITAMNLSVQINYDYPGYFHNGEAFGFFSKLINGTYDISSLPSHQHQNLSSTYPFIQASPKILTQQRNFLTPTEKILSFYSTQIKYLTAIVLLIAFVFILVIYKKREFAFAAFDVLRLLLSSALVVPFNRTATRIFFFGIFQLIIILHATFQGNLSAFLTKSERPYVDSMKDLETYKYDVYSSTAYRDQIEETNSKLQTINYISPFDCTEYVVNDSSAACIEAPERMLASAFKYNLHISSERDIPAKYAVLLCRENWPLKDKVDYYISHLVEAGLYEYLNDHNVNIPLQKLKSREEVETTARYRPIAMKDLAFAFRLLGVGLGISILVFMIEMFPWQKSLRLVKKWKKKCMKLSVMSRLRRRRN